MQLQIKKPYTALNSETYISLRQQELRTCRRIGYEFYCEELFVVKHKTSYSCESAIYFNLDTSIIIENCDFRFYYNKTVLDVGNEIILANWPNDNQISQTPVHQHQKQSNADGDPIVPFAKMQKRTGMASIKSNSSKLTKTLKHKIHSRNILPKPKIQGKLRLRSLNAPKITHITSPPRHNPLMCWTDMRNKYI